MRKIKLTNQEREIEDDLLKGEYRDADKNYFASIAQSIGGRRKDAVLNIRINSFDLENIKEHARKFGVRYQTFISEILHRVAQG